MRSPALAIAWEFARRHRIGLLVMLGYLLIVALVLAVFPSQRMPTVAGMSSLPLVGGFMLIIAVFSYGFETDLAARESCFPARKFTLPVHTAALVGWPMLYGTVSAALLWATSVWLIFRPCGLDLPVLWPALLAAATLAWTQVILWTPFGLPWLRVFVGVLVLAPLVAGPQIAVEYQVANDVLAAVLVPLLPTAFGIACVTTSRARRGDLPTWRWLLAAGQSTPDRPARSTAEFTSAIRAQVWFEW